MDSFKSGAISVGKYFRTFYRWVLLSVVTGLVCGLVGSAFHLTVDFATSFRAQHQWLVFLLPIGGLAIALIYRVSKMEGEGTNNIIDSIHDGEKVPIMLVPVIFVSTAITHLVGGSAGREGAALQIGGGIGYRVGRLLKLDDKDMRLVTLCGMSAVFAALFGTPLTATIFALEVISVGILHYSGLIPCLVASVTAYGVSLLFGIAPMRYSVALAPLEFGLLLRVCVLAVVCALVSIVFCVAMHKTEQFAAKTVKNIYLRAFLGGVIVIVLTLIVGDESYNGIGTDIIASALGEGKAPTWGFLWKIAFTAVTIGFGFKGGEIVPTMFIGAGPRLHGRAAAWHTGAVRVGDRARRGVLRRGKLPDSVDHPVGRAVRLGRAIVLRACLRHIVHALGLLRSVQQPEDHVLKNTRRVHKPLREIEKTA